MNIIHSVNDLDFVSVPVKIYGWKGEQIENEQQALLYKGEPKTATLLKATVYGEPYIKVTRLTHVYVHPYAQHAAALSIWFREPRKRRDSGFQSMAFDALGLIMIAWGEHTVNLEPIDDHIFRGTFEEYREKLSTSLGSGVLWHDGAALESRWLESRGRFIEAAGASVWFDTVESALKMYAAKYPDRK
jgi:hypothetical protein